jgi:hypothetical protein
MDEQDPSLAGGFRVHAIVDVPLELRVGAASASAGAGEGASETLRAKVLVKGPVGAPQYVRLEARDGWSVEG